jgi:hypothetical protein
MENWELTIGFPLARCSFPKAPIFCEGVIGMLWNWGELSSLFLLSPVLTKSPVALPCFRSSTLSLAKATGAGCRE